MLIDTTYNNMHVFAIASRKVYDLMYKLYGVISVFCLSWVIDAEFSGSLS